MQNYDDIKRIVKKIRKNQNEIGNKMPSLSNIHEALLMEFPKIKCKSTETRAIIIKHLKHSRDGLSKGIKTKLETLIFYILKDIAGLF